VKQKGQQEGFSHPGGEKRTTAYRKQTVIVNNEEEGGSPKYRSLDKKVEVLSRSRLVVNRNAAQKGREGGIRKVLADMNRT